MKSLNSWGNDLSCSQVACEWTAIIGSQHNHHMGFLWWNHLKRKTNRPYQNRPFNATCEQIRHGIQYELFRVENLTCWYEMIPCMMMTYEWSQYFKHAWGRLHFTPVIERLQPVESYNIPEAQTCVMCLLFLSPWSAWRLKGLKINPSGHTMFKQHCCNVVVQWCLKPVMHSQKKCYNDVDGPSTSSESYSKLLKKGKK